MSQRYLRTMAPLVPLAFLLPGFAGADATDTEVIDKECSPAGGFEFVCELVDPEDLVPVEDTPWVIVSSLTPGDGLYLIDSRDRSSVALYGSDAPAESQDMQRFGSCPGAPVAETFSTHGLYIEPAADEHHTLYVVGHGGREAIEVFDVDARGKIPALTWVGCVMLPEGHAANSVAALDDGSLLATVPLLPGMTIADAMHDLPTGAVFSWSPADAVWTKVEGTELPYGNGIEVSVDETKFYVASSGRPSVIAYANKNPSRTLRTSEPLDFVPDNLRFGPGGRLITAGLLAKDEHCGDVRAGEDFDLAEFAACSRPFKVSAFDTETMAETVLTSSPAMDQFSNITMAIVINGELWIGSFGGDRVALQPVEAE